MNLTIQRVVKTNHFQEKCFAFFSICFTRKLLSLRLLVNTGLPFSSSNDASMTKGVLLQCKIRETNSSGTYTPAISKLSKSSKNSILIARHPSWKQHKLEKHVQLKKKEAFPLLSHTTVWPKKPLRSKLVITCHHWIIGGRHGHTHVLIKATSDITTYAAWFRVQKLCLRIIQIY